MAVACKVNETDSTVKLSLDLRTEQCCSLRPWSYDESETGLRPVPVLVSYSGSCRSGPLGVDLTILVLTYKFFLKTVEM